MTDAQRWATDGVPDGAWMVDDGPYVLYADHIKEVNRASETYYQRYIDALWEAAYMSERIHYLESELSVLRSE